MDIQQDAQELMQILLEFWIPWVRNLNLGEEVVGRLQVKASCAQSLAVMSVIIHHHRTRTSTSCLLRFQLVAHLKKLEVK